MVLVPPQRPIKPQVRVEDATLDLRADARADLGVERVAQQHEHVGQRKAGLGREQIDGDPLMRRHHPGSLFAYGPNGILNGVFQIGLPEKETQRRGGQPGAA